MTAETNAAELAANFNRYFTSANGAAPNARISVPTAEWQALYAALLRAGAAKVPEPEEGHALALKALQQCLSVLDRVYLDLVTMDAMPAAGLLDARRMARAALATPPAPDAGNAPQFDGCAKSPTGSHSESWFGNGNCEHCHSGAQPDAPLLYVQTAPDAGVVDSKASA